jgi:DNA-directed RNA polymerase subunit M/transcription elongation factor TFIIS
MSLIKPKIKLNLNLNPTPILNPSNDHFENELKPYRNKVIEQLKRTQIKVELIIPIENCLSQKVNIEAERLRCGRNFDLYKSLYMSMCRHIIANLRTDNYINNTQFIDIVNSEKIKLDEAVDLDPQEMHRDRWKVLVEKKLTTIGETLKDPESTTDMFWCGKCHRNRCKYFERQDRSADEPMTLHITCCYCGHYWKQ